MGVPKPEASVLVSLRFHHTINDVSILLPKLVGDAKSFGDTHPPIVGAQGTESGENESGGPRMKIRAGWTV